MEKFCSLLYFEEPQFSDYKSQFLFSLLCCEGQAGQQFGGFHMGGTHAHDPKRMLQANTQRDNRDKNIKITLENIELWTKFHALGTEMIITKCGR